jgi:hypothetical protein
MSKKTAQTEENQSKQEVYKWTAKRKREAHNALVQQWNKNELNKRATVVVEYLENGLAVCKTIGRVKKSYTYQMPL